MEFSRGDYFALGLRWTSRVVEEQSEKIIWSSSAQLYSRKIDAVNEAKRLAKAFQGGRVEMKA